jgi:hypothetical protein
MLFLHFEELRLLAQKLLSLPRDCWILVRGDCGYCRSEGRGTRQRVWSFEIGLLLLAREYSTEHPFGHTVSIFFLLLFNVGPPAARW